MTNESRCLLATECRLAGQPAHCTDHCTAFIAMRGRSNSAGLPQRYRLTTLANSPAAADQAPIYRQLTAYAATFDRQYPDAMQARIRELGAKGIQPERAHIKSMYLWSQSPGTGKTTTAAALLNEWLRASVMGAAKRGKQAPQQPAMFLDINEWQSDYNLATMTNDDAGMTQVQATLKRAQAVDFLVIDDIGIRDATPAFKAYVHAIINARCAGAKPTVYTSNLPLEQMERVFDSRLHDRMRDMCTVYKFEGTSHRGGK